MKNMQGAKYLTSPELALLQECFDLIVLKRALVGGSEQVEVVASALFKAYARGVTDKDGLVGLADIATDPA